MPLFRHHFWFVVLVLGTWGHAEPPPVPDTNLFPGPEILEFDSDLVPLRLSLSQNFGNDLAIRIDFLNVARVVIQATQAVFDGALPLDRRPIRCFRGGPLPLIDSTSDPKRIWIRIALTDEDVSRRNYCRFAYQLSHELGHLYLDPRRSNGLIEALADAVSYRVLGDLPALWEKAFGDNPAVRGYAAKFAEYRDRKAGQKLACLPVAILDAIAAGRWTEVRSYLKQHNAELDRDPYCGRGLAYRGLAAIAFPREGPWRELLGLAGKTHPSPAEDPRYRDGLPTDLTTASPALIHALRRIGRE